MFSKIRVITAALAIALGAAVAYAQQPSNPTLQNQTPDPKERQAPFGPGDGRGFGRGQGRAFGRERGPRGLFDPRLMRELNLTDDQRRQIGDLLAGSFESTKTQREELRGLMEKRTQGTLTPDDEARARTLREQIQISMKDSESKIASVLTAGQKTKLEELMKERRENRERFRGRHGERSNPGTQPTPKPSTPNN